MYTILLLSVGKDNAQKQSTKVLFFSLISVILCSKIWFFLTTRGQKKLKFIIKNILKYIFLDWQKYKRFVWRFKRRLQFTYFASDINQKTICKYFGIIFDLFLIEFFFNWKIKEKGTSKFHSLQNIRKCLDYLKSNKVVLVFSYPNLKFHYLN